MTDKRRKALYFLLLASLAFSLASSASALGLGEDGNYTLVLFHSSTCPHCRDERAWLNESIRPRYPSLVIEEYEVNDYMKLFEEYAGKYNTTTAGVPRTFINGKVFVGFNNGEGDLVYSQGMRGYVGYSNQIERAIQECLKQSCSAIADKAIEISKEDASVKAFLEKHPASAATQLYKDDAYLVAWWSPERLSSNLEYPDLLVYIDPVSGRILRSEEPSSAIPDLRKPVQLTNWLNVLMMAFIALYLLLYLVFGRRLKVPGRFWVAGLVALVIVEAFVYFMTTPTGAIERYARGFPFPVFVFIIALADGFNPCAFTVLIVLLSLLTHTGSRKKMMLVGGVFILTSAAMYFCFIMAVNFLGSWVFAQYGELLFKLLGTIVLLAGLINLKDFFFFRKGISLSISDKNRDMIFRKAGGIVRKVGSAEDRRTLLAALGATVLLACLVNLVELGCTAMLPMAYMTALLYKYGNAVNLYHILYTAFYSLVYVVPLFVILADFIYTFKSERLSERSARVLKLAGGLVMVVFGLIMLLRPDALMLLR